MAVGSTEPLRQSIFPLTDSSSLVRSLCSAPHAPALCFSNRFLKWEFSWEYNADTDINFSASLLCAISHPSWWGVKGFC